MALKLQNEFVVSSPIEKTWTTLLDLGRVSRCLPGAVLEPNGGDGSYRGSMKVKLGPVTTEYRGVVRLEEVDEDAHAASFHVQGKETKGQGTASATIHNRLLPENGGTRVVVETELSVTGRPAQFGRGIMQDVAAKMLDEFARRLEQEILAEPAAEASPAKEAPRTEEPPRPAAEEPEALDLGAAVLGPVGKRAVAAGGVLLLLLLLVALSGRRRRGISIVARW